MKKFLYFLYAFTFGFIIGLIVALLVAPYPSIITRKKLKKQMNNGIGFCNKKRLSFMNKWGRFQSNVDDLYRLYTHQDEIVPVNKVYTEEY